MTNDSPSDCLRIGQLVDFQWVLGVATSSSVCKNVNSPYVTISLTVKQPSGHTLTKSFELSLPEFQIFSKEIKEAASVLETM